MAFDVSVVETDDANEASGITLENAGSPVKGVYHERVTLGRITDRFVRFDSVAIVAGEESFNKIYIPRALVEGWIGRELDPAKKYNVSDCVLTFAPVAKD